MAFFVVRTIANREIQVLDFIAANLKRFKGIKALINPYNISGYIFVEADNIDIVKQASYGVPYVKGVLGSEIPFQELESLIEFKVEDIDVGAGDIVQILAGPFKGEKAKVIRVSPQKTEIVVVLLESAVMIPITLNLDSIKVIEKRSAESGASQASEQGTTDAASALAEQRRYTGQVVTPSTQPQTTSSPVIPGGGLPIPQTSPFAGGIKIVVKEPKKEENNQNPPQNQSQ